MKYSDHFVSVLKKMGYTHCFYVAGGNIMHLLESASHAFECIPVVHEVSAGIAAEFFNESQSESAKKAFALVTAGPGLTNVVTAMAGAYLESRDLLVVGGQVKSTDLRSGGIRQLGIQEIDGMALTESLTVASLQIKEPVQDSLLQEVIISGLSGRKGPVFIEFCLDAQAVQVDPNALMSVVSAGRKAESNLLNKLPDAFTKDLKISKRPVLLLGGGVSRKTAQNLKSRLENLDVPVMTTWNATDRISSTAPSFFGRPNTWGQRYANILLQQSDLVMAVGTRLGLQQTGFNWQEFVPNGKLLQVEVDKAELEKENPKVDYPVLGDANTALETIIDLIDQNANSEWANWVEFSNQVKNKLPLSEPINSVGEEFVNSYEFFLSLSDQIRVGDAVVPSSSGASETVAMQALNQRNNCTVITTKGLASMGYGLAGAIGAAFAGHDRVLHVEGDGGFAQNLQELGTIAAQKLNVKTFLLCNDGYASIRMTQKSYFDGHYVGCDVSTGLGLPNWKKLFEAYGIAVTEIDPKNPFSTEVVNSLNQKGPHAYLVPVDPSQTYFPKITSFITESGSMQSNPLHLMTPELDAEVAQEVLRFLPK